MALGIALVEVDPGVLNSGDRAIGIGVSLSAIGGMEQGHQFLNLLKIGSGK